MKISTTRLFLSTLLLLVFFNEYLIYVLKAFFSWPAIKCKHNDSCSKILLVADPQILGEHKENPLARFDSDRFLRNAFSLALNHVDPDVVIFLGDLEDEGSQASDEQFERYYQRFRHIFQLERLHSSHISVFFTAGDNDIGGEGDERVMNNIVVRFRRYFATRNVLTINNIKIYEVNKLQYTFSKREDAADANITLTLAISHLPLTTQLSPFTDQVVRDLEPDFIFSAHEHKSYAVLTVREDGKQLYYEPLKQNAFRNGIPEWTFQGASTNNFTVITELSVPTCSYRMGSIDVGFGVIVQNRSKPKEIVYYTLWLPSRFASLLLYLMLLVVLLLAIGHRWTRNRRRYRKCYAYL